MSNTVVSERSRGGRIAVNLGIPAGSSAAKLVNGTGVFELHLHLNSHCSYKVATHRFNIPLPLHCSRGTQLHLFLIPLDTQL